MLAHLLGRLRWSPSQVWSATPREVAFALGGGGRSGMRGTELRSLMDRFPDDHALRKAAPDDRNR